MQQLPGRGSRVAGAAFNAIGDTILSTMGAYEQDKAYQAKKAQADQLKQILGGMVDYEDVSEKIQGEDGIFRVGVKKQATPATKIYEMMAATMNPETGDIPDLVSTLYNAQVKEQTASRGMGDLEKILLKNKLDLQNAIGIEDYKQGRKIRQGVGSLIGSAQGNELLRGYVKNIYGQDVYSGLSTADKQAMAEMMLGEGDPRNYSLEKENVPGFFNDTYSLRESR
jgi:hypothetical protein